MDPHVEFPTLDIKSEHLQQPTYCYDFPESSEPPAQFIKIEPIIEPIVDDSIQALFTSAVIAKIEKTLFGQNCQVKIEISDGQQAENCENIAEIYFEETNEATIKGSFDISPYLDLNNEKENDVNTLTGLIDALYEHIPYNENAFIRTPEETQSTEIIETGTMSPVLKKSKLKPECNETNAQQGTKKRKPLTNEQREHKNMAGRERYKALPGKKKKQRLEYKRQRRLDMPGEQQLEENKTRQLKWSIKSSGMSIEEKEEKNEKRRLKYSGKTSKEKEEKNEKRRLKYSRQTSKKREDKNEKQRLTYSKLNLEEKKKRNEKLKKRREKKKRQKTAQSATANSVIIDEGAATPIQTDIIKLTF